MSAPSKMAATVGSLWITTDRVPGDLYLIVGRKIVSVAYVALLRNTQHVLMRAFEQRDLSACAERIA